MCTELISIITALVSVIATAVTTIATTKINSRTKIKEKELDFNEQITFKNIEYYDKHRTEVIENFLKSACQCILNKDDNNLREFGASIPEIYLYVDETYWNEIDNLIKCINAGKHTEAMTVLIDFTKSINKINPQRQRIEITKTNKKKRKWHNPYN